MGEELADQQSTGNQPSWGVIRGDSGGAVLGLPPAPRPQLAEEMPLVLVREGVKTQWAPRQDYPRPALVLTYSGCGAFNKLRPCKPQCSLHAARTALPSP